MLSASDEIHTRGDGFSSSLRRAARAILARIQGFSASLAFVAMCALRGMAFAQREGCMASFNGSPVLI
jgi:UDP-N-acetyl-D-mannosaminuronic acid transferase (WecB/TagA/CpsF family)